jgi:hypothetical protein
LIPYRKTEALLDASKEVGLEVNPEKTKYLLVSRCQKAGQRQSIKMVNRCVVMGIAVRFTPLLLFVQYTATD